jgi:23S rRNA pseudouridine2605 synthase
MTQVRLQKFLAECGTGSRRKMEQFIKEGRVRVNGQVVTELGRKIDPSVDQVEVNRRPVRAAPKGIILLNKPRGVVSTLHDPEGRRTVSEFLTKHYASYFPVGRLDFDSTGLMILTNDGEMAEKLMHPRFGFERTYEARVEGSVPQPLLDKLESGIRLSDGFVQAQASIIRSDENSTWIEVRIKEGRNRIVRRLFEKLGHSVMKLKRTIYGPFKLGRLQVGQVRVLTAREFLEVRRKVMSFKGDESSAVEKSDRKKASYRPEGRLSDWEREHPRHPSKSEREDGDRPRREISRPDKPRSDRFTSDKPRSGRPRFERSRSDRSESHGPRSGRPRLKGERDGSLGDRKARPNGARSRAGGPKRGGRPTAGGRRTKGPRRRD